MEHQVLCNGRLQFRLILFIQGALHTAHGSGRPAETGVLSHRIVIIQFSSAPAAFKFSGKILVQLVLHFPHAPGPQRIIVQPPADIIMAAQIIQEQIVLRQTIYDIHLLFQEPYISGCHAVPGGRHGSHIIEHMTFRLLHSTKIWHHLLRLHDDLTQKQHTRTYDLTDHAHHTHDGMYLLQIPALRPQLLPDIRNRIDPDDIHPLTGQIQEVVHHLIEHPGITVIQIPLIGIKCSHHIMSHFFQISKITRRRGGKYLRYSPVILLRYGRIAVKEVTAHIFPVAFSCLFRPLMILRGVVHDKIHAQVDFSLMTRLCQICQLFHRPKLRLYLPKIRHRISAVRAAFGRLQEGHQMDTVHITGRQIVKLFLHSCQISRKIINVQHHSQHVISPEPLRILLSLLIQPYQLLISLQRAGVHSVA